MENNPKARSYKHPILEYIFFQYTENGKIRIGENIAFTYADIKAAANALGVERATSVSNFTLDLTRRNRPESRLPASIRAFGYDLGKNTGRVPGSRDNYAGEFVYVGVGNFLENVWLDWDNTPPQNQLVLHNPIDPLVLRYLRNDEGALFSVIDYCDVLSQAITGQPRSILRVQTPLKWHPNEIDGLYVSRTENDEAMLYTVEAKALSTRDHINLKQVYGGYKKLKEKIPDVQVTALCVQMVENGMYMGILQDIENGLALAHDFHITFDPPIPAWLK